MSDRTNIVYDSRDHLFTVIVDRREVGRAPSYAEAEALCDQYFRAERVLQQVTFPEGRIVLNMSEAAKALGMASSTLKQAIDNGELRAFRAGKQTIRISIWALREWIEHEEQKFAESIKPNPSILISRPYRKKT